MMNNINAFRPAPCAAPFSQGTLRAVRLTRFIRAIAFASLAMMAWLMTSKNAWAADAPLCHQDGASAQGREPVLVGEQTMLDLCEGSPNAAQDERAPTPPEERVTDEADPAIVTGWMWFARSPVSRLEFVTPRSARASGVRFRVDRPPQL